MAQNKALKNSLMAMYHRKRIIAALEKCGLSEAAKPLDLNLNQFKDIYNELDGLKG